MLDIKYRPQRFEDVIGNDEIVAILKKRSARGSLANRGILLGGPKGSGKTTLARLIAKAIICSERANERPCNSCDGCIQALGGIHPCILEFDAASHGSVDRIRSIVDEQDYSNLDGLPTILILDEAHRLGPAAQDALLKSMEDRRFLVIMCTTEPAKIRPALRDRMDEFPVRPSNQESILTRLRFVCQREGIEADQMALFEISNNVDGSMRVALNALEYIRSEESVTVASVRKYFKHDVYSALSHALMSIGTDVNYALSVLDPILSTESAAQVRTMISELVVNSFRKKNNLPHKWNDIANLFTSSFEYPWMDLVSDLSSIQRINIYDVEIALVKHLSKRPPEAYREEKKEAKPIQMIKSPTKVAPVALPPATTTRAISIDGITFSSEERVTSMHDRMEGTRGPTGPSFSEPAVNVKLDRQKIPISEQEFARGLIQRFKK